MMRVVWSRTIVAAFWFATAVYSLLSAIPFASEQFLKPGLSPALVAFARWHAWLSLAALVATAAGLAPWLRTGDRGARAFIALWALATLMLFLAAPLPRLEPSTSALALALLSLVPPVWISLMDLSRPGHGGTRPRHHDADDVSRDFAACAVAAIVVTAMHAIAPLPVVLSLSGWSAVVAGIRSLLVHLVVFSGIFAVICVIRGASRLISARDAVEAWMARGALACALAVFIFSVVLRPLSLAGTPGIIAAGAFGLALAVTLSPRATSAPPGLTEALGGLVPAWATRSGLAAILWLAAVATAIWTLNRGAAADWNFTIAKSAALVSWLLALAASLRVVRGRIGRSGLVPFAVCFVLLGLNQAASRFTAHAEPAAEAWKSLDPSIRLIADTLAPAAPILDEGLADFLQRHTNIPRGTRVEPVRIDLAALDSPPAPGRPHIFLFVIDSLRRDYLSPYNQKVSFTPAFEQFARESAVFERAFTRYGATGLSVPALWVGGLVLHKQYVTPFGPMNALAKLLEHEQYQQWIGMDNILDVILPPSPHREALDAGVQVPDYRFCRTLAEIRGRLDRLKTGGRPTFVYSLPQDIHVSVITREGAAPVDG